MGRMSDLHIDMMNAGWEGEPNEYLKMRARQIELQEREELCPNCFTDNLVSEENNELVCVECGYDFVRVGKALRFK